MSKIMDAIAEWAGKGGWRFFVVFAGLFMAMLVILVFLVKLAQVGIAGL